MPKRVMEITLYFKERSEKVQYYLKFGVPCICGHIDSYHAPNWFYTPKYECGKCTCPKYIKDEEWYKQMRVEEQQDSITNSQSGNGEKRNV
jgi:hypothetical protein